MLLDQIKAQVRPEVPGCPEPILADAVIESARDFATNTGVIRDVVTLDSIEDQAFYTLPSASTNNEYLYIYAVWRENDILHPAYEAPKRRIEEQGRPFYYTFSNKELRLIPTPQAVEEYYVEAVVRPLRTASELDMRFADHADTLAYCVKYKLMMMAGQSWSNPSDAVYNRERYETLKNDARWLDKRAHTDAPISVKMRPFA